MSDKTRGEQTQKEKPQEISSPPSPGLIFVASVKVHHRRMSPYERKWAKCYKFLLEFLPVEKTWLGYFRSGNSSCYGDRYINAICCNNEQSHNINIP
jgi:hypothetical protein